ncbi:MAG TPA: sigma-70 family RNA polymerase sigma factor [Bryobacteraceae bacterium]|nr:sigma-70 family RNA polymerase sigma factor [Bryobacteraceae bacterium]
MSEVTRILEAVGAGRSHAAEELLPMVYEELRRLASQRMANESANHTLQPTALVHEAWLRLVHTEGARFENRGHFFAAAAEAMRRILIERARRKRALRHGGGWERVDLNEIDAPATAAEPLLLEVSEVLTELEREAPRAAELVKFRFFGGFTFEDAARLLGVTSRTARRDWRFARAWLRDALRNRNEGGAAGGESA